MDTDRKSSDASETAEGAVDSGHKDADAAGEKNAMDDTKAKDGVSAESSEGVKAGDSEGSKATTTEPSVSDKPADEAASTEKNWPEMTAETKVEGKVKSVEKSIEGDTGIGSASASANSPAKTVDTETSDKKSTTVVSSSANSTNGVSDNPLASSDRHQTVYKILDDAMAVPQSADGRAYVHPVLFDCLLACGLLIAMGGFTIGLLKIYITHSAEQSMNQRNYKAAIGILRGAPFPGWFTVKGRDPQELLNQAIYLEAMDKLDANKEDQSAINELTQIKPGSKFFELAQEIVRDHTQASEVQLEGRTEHEASPKDPVVEDNMPVLPPEPKE